MNTRFLIAGASIALTAATMLAACGGGSGSSGGMSASPSMAGASGVITGFGSVFVDGREFATDMHTQVLDGDNDDAPSTTSNLQVGMTVDVDAAGSSATMLRFISAVRGEVDAVDSSGMMTLTVLGQTVQVTGGTSFAGNAGNASAGSAVKQLSDIHVGDYVVVFGYLECSTSNCSSGATDIVATLVVEPASIGKYRVQGYVNNGSSGGFTINGLTVNITASTMCNTMNCAFTNGDFVSVRSSMAPTGTYAATGSTLTLAADDVKLRSMAPTFAVGSTVTIEGPVTQLAGTMFVVRAISVDASASGLSSTVAGLADNQMVEVTGTISSSGTLVATSIVVEQSATFLLMGPLDSVSSSGLTVLGQSFSVTGETRFADWATDVRPFNSTNFATVLAAGDQLVVSGYPGTGGNVATRVERIQKPASPAAAVAGIVSADNPSMDTLTEAGITVTLSPTTVLFYPGGGNMPTLTGFFGAITPNTTFVGVYGTPGLPAGSSAITAADAFMLRLDARWMKSTR